MDRLPNQTTRDTNPGNETARSGANSWRITGKGNQLPSATCRTLPPKIRLDLIPFSFTKGNIPEEITPYNQQLNSSASQSKFILPYSCSRRASVQPPKMLNAIPTKGKKKFRGAADRILRNHGRLDVHPNPNQKLHNYA